MPLMEGFSGKYEIPRLIEPGRILETGGTKACGRGTLRNSPSIRGVRERFRGTSAIGGGGSRSVEEAGNREVGYLVREGGVSSP